MKGRKFKATVKEREAGQPCFVVIEPYGPIYNLGSTQIMFDLPAGTKIEHAQELARALMDSDATVRVG